MTKERKIEILKDLLVQLSDSANILCTCEADERCEVVEECIKALEQQTNDCKIFGTKENCFGGATENECEHCDYKIQKLEQPTSEDCVSREKVHYMITGGKYANEDYEQFIDRLVKELENMPPVTPTCKQSEWYLRGGKFTCKNCEERALLKLTDATGGCREYSYYTSNFCPNCGAEMKGGRR